MDNLCSHKSNAIRTAIRGAGTKLLFLPPYSPDLNPIEQVFSKLKLQMRRMTGRTALEAEITIAKILPEISKQECQNYITDPGYESA